MSNRPVIGEQLSFHSHHCDLCGKDCFIPRKSRCEGCGRWFVPQQGECCDVCPRCAQDALVGAVLDALKELFGEEKSDE